MSAKNSNYRPVLKFLFQHQERIRKELERYLLQDDLFGKSQCPLSNEACAGLRDKLLSYPLETACVLHQIHIIENKCFDMDQVHAENTRSADEAACKEKSVSISEESAKTRKSKSKMQHVYLECFDHLFRRIENLHDKVLQLEKELEVVLKKPINNGSPRRSVIGKTSEPIEMTRLKDRMQASSAEKCRNIALLYLIVSLAGDVSIDSLKDLFPRMLTFCYDKNLIAPDHLYYSNFSCSREGLQSFCEEEDTYISSRHIDKPDECLGAISPQNARKFYFDCIKNSKHFLQYIFEVVVHDPIQSTTILKGENNWDNCLIPLCPMIFLNAWSTSLDKLENLLWIARVWEKQPKNIDPLLMKICDELQRDVSFVSWCMKRNANVKVLPLLLLIRDHSPLYTLYRSLPLHDLQPDEVSELLTEHCHARDPTGNLLSLCLSSYKAFCILNDMFQILAAGMQLDNSVAGQQARGHLGVDKSHVEAKNVDMNNDSNSFRSRQSLVSFYKKNVAEKLLYVKEKIFKLQPLEYRIEVMEDIFSLLFIRHSDMSDENRSESGGDEGDLERSLLSHRTGSESPTSMFAMSNPNTSSSIVSERQEDPLKTKKVLLLDFVEEALDQMSDKTPSQAYIQDSDNQSMENSVSRSSLAYSSSSGSLEATAQSLKVSYGTSVPEPVQAEGHHCSSQGGTAAYHQSSCTVSGKSTLSSLGELPRTGYIINSLVAWDILLLLNECVLATSAEKYAQKANQTKQNQKVSSGHSLHSRISFLSRYINEGLWRLQVLLPCGREIGSVENFDEYVDGKLFSENMDISVYEGSSGKISGQDSGKKRHETNDGRQLVANDSSSVINFLLAPAPCLVTLALTKGNLSEAEQVIKLYRNGDSMECREVYLARRLKDLRPKLFNASQRASKVKGNRSTHTRGNSQDTLLTLGLVAREASAQAGAMNSVHELLSTLSPPIPFSMPVETSEASCPIMSSFLNPQSLVLSDLAITIDLTETTASLLLEQALQRHKSNIDIDVSSNNSKSEDEIQGYIPLVRQIATTCNRIISLKEPNPVSGAGSAHKMPLAICDKLGPPVSTPLSLLLSSYPVDDEEMKMYIQGWSRVLVSVVTLEDMLLNPISGKEGGDEDYDGEYGIHKVNNEVHLAYKEVLKVLSEEASYLYPSKLNLEEVSKFGAYIRSFYQYLQLMSAMVTRYANKNFVKGLTSYFSILSIRPVHILGSLMFQDGVDPGKLEHTAQKMKLDLTSMILQYCCPKINVCNNVNASMMEYGAAKDSSIHLGYMVMDECIIMNAGSMQCQSGVYGELVVRDVLTTLLSGLREIIQPLPVSPNISHKAVLLNDITAVAALQSQEVVMVLKDTTDLASVDFRKIASGDEAVVFFINLANLMFIHAGLLNHIVYPSDNHDKSSRGIFSNFQFERIMAMKRFGYTVGQLGFLSLYDILYSVLKLQNPLSSVLIQNGSQRFTICESSLWKSSESAIGKDDLEYISSLLCSMPQKINFCVTQGSPISPCVQVLYCDRMGEQIDEAVSEHLNLFLHVEKRVSQTLESKYVSGAASAMLSNHNGSRKISTSRTLLDYLANYNGGVAGGVKNLEKFIPEELASILRSFSRNSDRSEISILDREVKPGISLEYIEGFEIDEPDFSKNISEDGNVSDLSDYASEDPANLLARKGTVEEELSDPSSWLSVRVPVAVLSHLRKQCPLLAFIVQAIHSTLEASKRGQSCEGDTPDMWLNILYPPSIGVKPPAEETAIFRACRNLFSSSKHQVLSTIAQDNRVLSSLIHEPDISLVWQLADRCLGSSNVTKDGSSLLVSQVSPVLSTLKSLYTSVLESHPDLKVLKDHLLAFMVQVADSPEDDYAPWDYAHEISNAEMRFNVIQTMHRSWPVFAAIEMLQFLECDLLLTQQQQTWAKERAIQIRIYFEILEAGRPDVESWQEVANLSVENPSSLLSMLIHRKCFKLGVLWAEHHNVDSKLKQLVDQSYLMSVLDMTSPDYGVASNALESLGMEDLIVITESLLLKLSSIPTRRFLLEFLLKTIYPRDLMQMFEGQQSCNRLNEEAALKSMISNVEDSSERIKQKSLKLKHLNVSPLRQELMGLALVEDVAPLTEDRFQLSHLASNPHLIIEQWLMNIKLEPVEKSVRVIGKHLDMIGPRSVASISEEHLGIRWSLDEMNEKSTDHECLSWDTFNWLLEAYAAKALDTTGVQFTLKPKQVGDRLPKMFVMPSQPPDRNDWVPDSEVRECSVCNVAVFSMFCRRHHCRRCGRVVCGSCSKSRMTVLGYGDLLVRVCQDCFCRTKDINPQDFEQVRPLGDGNIDGHSELSEDILSLRGSSSLASDIEGGWYLSTEQQHNSLVRQEFCYDSAPSLSLCLAILSQHQDDRKAAVCIVKLCHHLFSLIVSAIICTSPEVDHNFVLSMIQTLLTSSKVRFGNVYEHQGIAVCEYYSQWVDLLSLLLKASCGDVIPLKALQNMIEIGELHQKLLLKAENCKKKLEKCLQQEYIYMRHIRDALVKKKLWELSLNISTKVGLDATGVWGAWAMASLKAGDFPGARERFARILERPLDKNRIVKSSLLPEIIKYLESCPFHVNEKVIDNAERTRVMLSDQTRLPPSQALVVLHTLQSLKDITEGSTRKRNIAGTSHLLPGGKSNKKKSAYKMDPLFQNECKYYLRLYGNHSMNIKFFMRHRQLHECAEYLLEAEVKEDIFIEEVLLPCLRFGRLEEILKVFRTEDPQQSKWFKYMLLGCRWLEHNCWWNCLLTVQEALGDRLRAVMTLLSMYNHEINSYSGLSNKIHILASAQHHLKTYLNTQILHGSFAKSKIILNTTAWQVNQYITMLDLQTDVVKFLAFCEMNYDMIPKLLPVLAELKIIEGGSLPTLLGGENERLAVGALAVAGAPVVERGLCLAYRIVDTMGVPAARLLSVGSHLLVYLEAYDNVGNLVKGMQEYEVMPGSVVDAALEPALLKMSSSTTVVNLDVLIKLFSSEIAKIEAYIKCGRLKSAYLIAVRQGKSEDVILVQEAAMKSGQAHVATMCTKWLANHKSIVGAH